MKLSYFAPALLLLLLCSAGCKKSNYQDVGVITGFDHRTSPSCAGGLYMNFYNLPYTVIANSYDVKNTPSSLNIDSTTQFPVYLLVDWTYIDQASCPQDITITSWTKE